MRDPILAPLGVRPVGYGQARGLSLGKPRSPGGYCSSTGSPTDHFNDAKPLATHIIRPSDPPATPQRSGQPPVSL
jgi:hypothetical protein